MVSLSELNGGLARRAPLFGPALLIFGVSFSVFLSQSFLDPDPHHDGIQLAAAVSVLEGAVPQVGAFSQYGPLAPLLQAAWMRLTVVDLLSLRLLSSLALALCAMLMTVLLRRLGTNWRWTLSAVVTWTALFPAVVVPGFGLLPWPSDYFLALTLLVMIVIASQRERENGALLWFVVAGALLGTGAFLRLQVTLVILGVLCVGAILAMLVGSRRAAYAAICVVVGAAAGICSGLLLLQLFGGLQSYTQQAIVGPASFYAGRVEWTVLAVWGIVAVIGAIAFISSVAAYKLRSGDLVVRRSIAIVWLGSAFLASAGPTLLDMSSESVNSARLKAFSTTMAYSPLAWAAGILIAGSGILVLKASRGVRASGRFSTGKPREMVSGKRLALIAVALGSTVQFAPLFDVYHLWWAAAPAVVIVAAGFARVVGDHVPSRIASGASPRLGLSVANLVAFPVALGLSFGAVFAGLSDLAKPRVAWPHSGALENMHMSEEARSQFEWVYEQTKTVQAFVNLCPDALWVVLEGEFKSANWRTVDWAWPESKEPPQPGYYLKCAGGNDSRLIGRHVETLAQSSGGQASPDLVWLYVPHPAR